MRCISPALAGDGVHYTYDIVPCGCFRQLDISVSKKDHSVGVNLYDSVYQMVASCVSDQGHCSFPDVIFLPWTEAHLVSQMDYKRVHAVALDRDGHSLSFRNQLSDFLHHYGLVYRNCLGHFLSAIDVPAVLPA